jgi:hypothetical protein
VNGGPIADVEVVYRRIPRATDWFEEPDKITTANLKLDHRRNDLGVSVYRAQIVTPEQVLTKPDATPHSLLASAVVADIRALRNGKGEPLDLDVVCVDDEDDPGHAEIRGPEPGKLSSAASKALRDLFKLV